MIRKYTTIALLAFSSYMMSTEAFAQVENLTLVTNGKTFVQTAPLQHLTLNKQAYTIQCLFNAQQWEADATLFTLADLSLKLGQKQGELILTLGQQQEQWNVPTQAWNQLTLIASAKGLQIVMNGEQKHHFNGNYALSQKETILTLAQGFEGRIDEFRIWDTQLPQAHWNLQNTVNKFHPYWEDLALYYKFDQKLPNAIVDYKNENHAYAKKGKVERIAVKDNPDFLYRYINGYSSFTRHSDRQLIDKDMHLMTNDLIMLDALVDGNTGTIEMESSEDATLTGSYKAKKKYQQRTNVLALEGEAQFNFGKYLLSNNRMRRNGFTFSAWLAFENTALNQHAYLLKRTQNPNNQFNLKLQDKNLLVEIDQHTLTFANALINPSAWNHIAVNVAEQNGKMKVSLFLNNKLTQTQYIDTLVSLHDVDAETIVGENLHAVIDDVIIRKIAVTNFADEMQGKSKDLIFPMGGTAPLFVDAHLSFENPKELGKNSMGWKAKLADIKALYAGHEGFKVRLGIITHTKDNKLNQKAWIESINRKEWRDTLVAEVAKLMPYFDGLDIDFEWLDNNPKNKSWTGYAELAKGLRSVIPSPKLLSASLHPVSYKLPLEAMQYIDFITVQNYGPRPTFLYMDAYKKYFADAVAYGIDPKKLHLSMATLIVRKDNFGKNVAGYKDLDFEGFTTTTSEAIFKGEEYTFNSVEQVKEKAQHLVENGSRGIMYFDMGNDLNVHNEFSLIRALNSVIASNVDPVVIKIKKGKKIYK